MIPRFSIYDAHNHLQDERLKPHLGAAGEGLDLIGMRGMIVNGTREEDWESVAELAERDERVTPSFGLHPWHVGARSAEWLNKLERRVDSTPSGVGEIGLDKWIEGVDFTEQEEAFTRQLRLAAKRNRPVSIHCLKAWGPLAGILRRERLPECGFLLHSYGGSSELIEPLARLGAFFSISGYFAHERKERQREVFRQVPRDRLLIETDAPDMLPPEKWNRHVLKGAPGLNHPANIAAIYEFAAGLLQMPILELAGQVEENFNRLFGSILR